LDLQINSQIFFSSFRYGPFRENPFSQTVGPQLNDIVLFKELFAHVEKH
jgi:hypothetical protein